MEEECIFLDAVGNEIKIGDVIAYIRSRNGRNSVRCGIVVKIRNKYGYSSIQLLSTKGNKVNIYKTENVFLVLTHTYRADNSDVRRKTVTHKLDW